MSAFRTSEGYVGGAITDTAWTYCEPKRVGSTNSTTAYQQAEKEALAKMTKQKKKGWTENQEDMDSAARKHLPMLAKKWEDEGDRLLSSGCILAAQPKLDGIRNVDTIDGPFTKEGGVHNPAAFILHEHSLNLIDNTLITSTDQPDYSKEIKLDGELYNHEYKADFNAIVSIVRTKTPNEEQLALAKEKLQYHLYDINAPGPFAQRYAALKILLEQNPHPAFKLVETVFINTKGRSRASIEAQLDELHKRFINEGYEGSMIRNAESLYEPKRTRNLLKRKDWIDDEFEIVDILSGKGNKANIAASVECRDKRGEVFSAGIIGNESYCRDLLIEKNTLIGKMATIKHQNLTPDKKVPRFGKLKAIRDYE